MFENKKLYISCVVCFLIGAGIAVFFGQSYFYEQGYAKAQGEIRQTFESAGVIPPMPKELFSAYGGVYSIDVAANSIILDANPPYDPLAKGELKTTRYIVRLSDKTDIVQRKIDDNAAINETTGEVPFADKKISLDLLRPGDKIYVDAAENIVGKDGFAANKVILTQ